MHAAREPKAVVCNTDARDPGAYVDRRVLEDDPYSVLEGMLIAAYAVTRRLGITDGEPVRVRSRYGAIELASEITDRVRPGELFATFSDPERHVNPVTGPHRDTRTRTPE
jgi:hypothetical protein